MRKTYADEFLRLLGRNGDAVIVAPFYGEKITFSAVELARRLKSATDGLRSICGPARCGPEDKCEPCNLAEELETMPI